MRFLFSCFIGIALLLTLGSCTLHRLDVQTQYLTPDYLASNHIGTPDPRRYEPLIGQRLLIQWSLTDEQLCNQELLLYLIVRFRDRQEEKIWIPVTSKRGTYLFNVDADRFIETKGVLTYYAQIQSSTTVLACWKHPLWVELIQFNDKPGE